MAAGLAAVAVIAAGALLVLPFWLDWSRYRVAIASYAAGELGRPVQIDGPISVTLLPRPLVTAVGVRLGDRGDGITLVAPSLRLRLAAAPLLLGRLVPRELVLSGAAIRLPWPLPPSALTPGALAPARITPAGQASIGSAGTGAGERAESGRGWLGRSAAHIEHGTISVGALQLNDVNADLTSETPEQGGLAVTGSAKLFGQRWRFTDRLGALDSAGAAPFEISLDAEPEGVLAEAGSAEANLAAAGRFIGTLAADGSLAGRLTAHAADLSRLMPSPVVAARLDGTVGIGRGPATAQLTLVIGGTAIAARLQPAPAGAAEAQELSLRTGRLDLDAWGKALARHGGARTKDGAAAGNEDRGGTRRLQLPWPVSLDLAADAMQLHGGLVRGFHAALDVRGDRGVIRSASATLPGEAAVTMPVGALVGQPDGLSLTGRVALDAPQLRTTLAWLRDCGLRLGKALPPEVLRTAALTGAVQASRERIDLTGLAGTVEDAKVSGRAGAEIATGAIDADLTIDRLAMDNWLPVVAGPGAEAGGASWQAVSRALGGFAVDLKLHAGTVQVRGHLIEHLDLDAATSAGGLAINAAAFDLGGLHGAGSGTIAADGQVADAKLDLGTDHGSEFARRLPPWARFTEFLWGGQLRVHAEATGPLDALIASLSVDLDDARLEAHPVIDLNEGGWTAQMTLRHPGAPRLLRALGLPHAGDWLGEGSLSMLAQLSGGPGQVHADSFDLTAGTLHATGALKLDRRDSDLAPMLTGRIDADSLPLPPFVATSTEPADAGLLTGWGAAVDVTAAKVLLGDVETLQPARAKLTLANGVLTVGDLQAGLAGGALTGKIVLDASVVPPREAVDGQVKGAVIGGKLFATPIDLTGGSADATVSLAASGYSAAAMLASLSGSVQARIGVGRIAGIDLKAVHAAVGQSPAGKAGAPLAGDGAIAAALNGGGSQFDALSVDAAISNGVVALSRIELNGPDGAATGRGAIDLPAESLSVLAHLPDQVDVRLTGPVGAPRRLVEPPTVALSP